MSRQRRPSPTRSRQRYFQTSRLAWLGTTTPSSTPISGNGSGKSPRPARSLQRGGAGAGASASSWLGAPAGAIRRWPGRVSPRARTAAAATCSGPTPQQPPMICAPSSRQASASSAKSPACDGALVAPAGRGQIPEVGVDAEREVGEVAQPREHPGGVVGRDAVDQQRGGAELLEAARGAAEGVALGTAPVLAVDAADAVAAAPEARATAAARSPAAPRSSGRSRGARARASPAGSGRAGRPRTRGRAGGSSPGRRACRRRR